jgi:tRNA (mo5U34)-methyltransferase
MSLADPALRAEVERIPWWHRIDLGGGLITPGPEDTTGKLATLRLPASLAGKTVLDVGAWDGFYSFEAERRGAVRVLATDWISWNGSSWGSKAGFELARRVLGSRVEDRTLDLYDLSPDTVGRFDVVLFLGVLYHLKHPLLALERIASVTRELLVVETHAAFRGRTPTLEFYPGAELSGDPTNWFGPNPAAVEGMLKVAGFSRIVPVWRSGVMARALRTVYQRLRKRSASRLPFHHGRLVVHAHR